MADNNSNRPGKKLPDKSPVEMIPPYLGPNGDTSPDDIDFYQEDDDDDAGGATKRQPHHIETDTPPGDR